ncbi:iron ABC transporter permease [Poseidonocella sp. HB161398]|uniref:FecCD family ABC transporter permease n=1 Tax=Poseidonocella sp. HB161398 TaxID=2320855 RepID=UPI001F0F94BD|nr:iron ABC transporter permease [Poseidonocella sp. HB161398]
MRRPLAAGLLLAALALASLSVGTHMIAPRDLYDALFAFDPASTEQLILRELRLPRTLLAALVGAGLGVSGVVMQALSRNPLADPGILGVNAGATFAIVAAIAAFGIESPTGYMWFGLLGAAAGSAAVFVLGGMATGREPVRAVLAGAALSVMLLSLTHVVIVNSDMAVFDRFRHWAVGSLQGRGADVVQPVAALTFAGLAGAAALARGLDAMALGAEIGRSLGAAPERVWLGGAAVIVCLSGAATAAAGPVAFVGLVAPHLARAAVGPNHAALIPATAFLAAALVMAADVAGRLVIWPAQVPVGVMAALIGGPVFVALVRRRRILAL